MSSMPKIVRPSDQPAIMDAYMSAFGNRARITIIKYLQTNGASLRVDIAQETGLPNPTLGHHLSELERVGVVKGDLPPEMRRGRTMRYSIDPQRVDELLAVPGDYING